MPRPAVDLRILQNPRTRERGAAGGVFFLFGGAPLRRIAIRYAS